MTTLIAQFEIPSGRPLSEEESGACGPSAELTPFVPARLSPRDVIGRMIVDYTVNSGTYGMGGAGFFGFELDGEWLIISLWGAATWLQIEDRVVMDQQYREFGRPEPLLSDTRDAFTPLVVGHTIEDVLLEPKSLSIRLSNGVSLEIRESGEARPKWGRDGDRETILNPEDDLRSAVFLSPTPELWI